MLTVIPKEKSGGQTRCSLDGIAQTLLEAGCASISTDGKSLSSARVVHNYLCRWTR